ncbi:DISARM system phospholipase D-like protein DrmC [Alicyclobacillus acidoterrestris]|uniref:DISARM system phospholipase D-like protein DrmC n=1 Tax=Alicyclobacillus acidoterrestris (strain ATCC 49025 / DSM 3922 / CIP 106132 / NCIMB 13137 / GD3B) TaxID=1356854 RepID=T0DCF4_ALIAG|nr:DISARM system phospholipase D-like protein DrmC [Alicyclobacillus acidoterrestris]EPZ47361.1 hypothetical protein N007_06430 [Alicyclobacillus acidoterrestris ATCC 49025]UNO49060.1 DISARM system phospholipase D-like protein DrmC [Alicyclobacillus acidoterrestris]
MDEFWQVVAEIGLEIHPQRINSISRKINSLDSIQQIDQIKSGFWGDRELALFDRLRVAWGKVPYTSPAEVSSALYAASATSSVIESRNVVELVWTGPSTGLVPVRHTEQVLREVIAYATKRIFLVSFVAYEVDTIIKALQEAVARQVRIDVLLESPSQRGGHVSFDSITAMKSSIPAANVYTWMTKPDSYVQVGSVHAKCAVADSAVAFVTSANLSQAAMEKNMELGVLVRGGAVPQKLEQHLDYLVTTGVVQRV